MSWDIIKTKHEQVVFLLTLLYLKLFRLCYHGDVRIFNESLLWDTENSNFQINISENSASASTICVCEMIVYTSKTL